MSVPVIEAVPILTDHCEVCEADLPFVAYGDEEPWCSRCGIAKSMLEPDDYPGGCEQHPNATHEVGFGLAGGGFGPYSICNECGTVFDKHPLPDDEA